MGLINKIKEFFSGAEEEVRYIIGGDASGIDSVLAGEDHKHVHENKAIKFRVVKVKKSKAANFHANMKKHVGKKIDYIEEDFKAEVHFTPNDPSVSAQWHLAAVKMFEAWDIDRGLNPPLIANIDSGADFTHPDLQGVLTAGHDYASNDDDPTDEHGHGTATAGTYGALGNNGIGVCGILQKARILVIRALDSTNYGYYSWWASAITEAVDKGALVVNMSMGGTNVSSTLQNAVNYLVSKGRILIVSAGNSGSTAPSYPAACAGAIAVSATDSSGNKAGWSNYGPYIRLAAPGEGILTTHKGGTYANWSGTSFSAPIVTGIAALVWGKYPSLTRQQVIDILQDTADNKNLGFTQELGYGIVNAHAALLKAATIVGQPPAPDTMAPTIPGGLSSSNIQATSFNVSWGPSTDNVGVTGYEVFANGISVGTTDRALFGLNNLTPATTYSVQVRARDAAGNWSGLSAILSVSTADAPPPPAPDTTKPSTPTNLVASGVSQTGFNLSWTASTDNVGVTAYQILLNGTPYSITTSTSAKVTNLASNIVYNVSIRARDAAGNWSDESAVIQVILTLKKKGRWK